MDSSLSAHFQFFPYSRLRPVGRARKGKTCRSKHFTCTYVHLDVRGTLLAMFSSCRCKPEVEALKIKLAGVEAEQERLLSVLRQYQTEQVTMHDQVRKWMRRSDAAEARATKRAPGEPNDGGEPTATPPRLWGARARRLMRPPAIPTAEPDKAQEA